MELSVLNIAGQETGRKVAPVQVVSRTLCLEEGVECLDPYQEIIASN